MNTETVTVSILGRDYHVKLKTGERSEVVKAGENITATLQQMEKQYKVADAEELLTMAIIKIATDYEHLCNEKNKLQSFAYRINTELKVKINSYLDTEKAVL